jgi:hypothetical protein
MPENTSPAEQNAPLQENTPVEPVVVPPTAKPASRIHLWALAISVQEGAKKELNNPGNLKVSTLTKSWGAANGFQAEDGG